MTDNNINKKMTEEELNELANKIVGRMVRLKSMEDWYDHVSKSNVSWIGSYENLQLTEEEGAISESAKLMTLMHLFQEKEEYEKCAIVKNRLDEVNKILDKY